MKRPTDRRAVLMVAGAAAIAAATETTAQPVDIRGAVYFAGGAAIPAGYVQIYVEDLAIQDSALRRVAETRIESNGGLTEIGFSFPKPVSVTDSPKLQIVARLERADGWLVARGSTQIKTDAPVHITLKEAIY